jgi:hypothetical protein
MLGKMTTPYYATMVAANEAAHKINALIAINNAAARSGMAHYWLKRLSVLLNDFPKVGAVISKLLG